MIYDCFLFHNELDLLEIRLHTLRDVVDRFVLVEATRTHQGEPKQLSYRDDRGRFCEFGDRIIAVVVDDLPEGEDPPHREHFQRNCIIRGLGQCGPDDLLLISDVDEIPRPQAIPRAVPAGALYVFEQTLYYYHLRCRGTAKWMGTRLVRRADLTTPQAVRESGGAVVTNGGWHFSYFGGVEGIRTKLLSFSHQGAQQSGVADPQRLAACIADGRDLWGRAEVQFQTVNLDTSYPPYVLANPDRFAHFGAGPLISAVIPVKGRLDLTERCVSEIRRCLQTAGVCGEVIVVDSDEGSSREWCEANGCRWVDYPTQGAFSYPHALNLGVAAASAEIVLISNSDVADVGSKFVARALERFAASPMTGLVSVGADGEPINAPPRASVGLWFAGWHYCVRKSIWNQIGGACESMSGYGYDECDTSVRLGLAGYVVEILEDIPCQHLAGQTYLGDAGRRQGLAEQLRALALSLGTEPRRVDEILAETSDAWQVVGEITEACRRRLRLRARIGLGDRETYGLQWHADGLHVQNAHFSSLEADLHDLSQLHECARVVQCGGTLRVRMPTRPDTIVSVLRSLPLRPVRLDFSDGFAAELRVSDGEAL